MKAAVLEDKGVMTYQEIPTPQAGKSEVVLKVKASFICGSDLMRYSHGHRTYHLVLGHETAGVVAEVGEGVDPALVGRHAALIPLMPCMECEQCRAGRYSACRSYSFLGSRRNGGYAEYVLMPARNLLLLPDEMPFEYAALVEPSTVARHALDLGQFKAGQSVVVFGAGSVGLMAVQWLRILGASQIISIDISDSNLETARALGATLTLNPLRDDVKTRAALELGAGADLSIEAAGSPITLAQTLQITRPGGWVVLVGNQPQDASLPMTFIEEMMRKEIHLVGCFMSYSAPFPGHEWTDTIQAVKNGELDMEAMISHRFPLSKAGLVFHEITVNKMPHRKVMLNPEEA